MYTYVQFVFFASMGNVAQYEVRQIEKGQTLCFWSIKASCWLLNLYSCRLKVSLFWTSFRSRFEALLGKGSSLLPSSARSEVGFLEIIPPPWWRGQPFILWEKRRPVCFLYFFRGGLLHHQQSISATNSTCCEFKVIHCSYLPSSGLKKTSLPGFLWCFKQTGVKYPTCAWN